MLLLTSGDACFIMLESPPEWWCRRATGASAQACINAILHAGLQTMKNRILVPLGGVVIVGIGAVLLIPSGRSAVRGWFRPSLEMRLKKVSALIEKGESAVPELIAALHDEDIKVRTTAGGALGRMGPGALAAVPALRDGLDENIWMAKILQQIGAPAAIALGESLNDPNPSVRFNSAPCSTWDLLRKRRCRHWQQRWAIPVRRFGRRSMSPFAKPVRRGGRFCWTHFATMERRVAERR